MQQHEAELEKRNVKVLVVTFEAGFFARTYVEDTGLRWPLVPETNRELDRAYGMLEAGFLDIWGPGMWWAYLKEIVHGRLPVKSEGEISQRGGDVLIDPKGIVRFHHIGKGPGGRPPVKTILRAME